jgi:peptidoglycan/xylan/chitin deacetylase (PgdA/CDA1 family)
LLAVAGIPFAIFGLSAGVVLAGNAIGTAAGQDTTVPVAAVGGAEPPARPELPHTVPVADVLHQRAPGRDIDCRHLRCVAITFDDGPGVQTRELLEMLRAENAVATWFPVGEVAVSRPGMLRRIAEAGHEIGNHTWDHAQLTRRDGAAIDNEVGRTARAIRAITGTRPRLVRPPYGAVTPRVAGELARLGDPVVLWDVDPLDWKYRDSGRVARSVLSQVRPGSIVLLHDIHATTVAAVPRILHVLAARGYTFVTVSELYRDALTPGKLYHARHRGGSR